MPRKKSKKRTRDERESEDNSALGPPRKRAKTSKPTSADKPIRRSLRSKKQPGDWWKTKAATKSVSASESESGSESESESDSSEQETPHKNSNQAKPRTRSQTRANNSKKRIPARAKPKAKAKPKTKATTKPKRGRSRTRTKANPKSTRSHSATKNKRNSKPKAKTKPQKPKPKPKPNAKKAKPVKKANTKNKNSSNSNNNKSKPKTYSSTSRSSKDEVLTPEYNISKQRQKLRSHRNVNDSMASNTEVIHSEDSDSDESSDEQEYDDSIVNNAEEHEEEGSSSDNVNDDEEKDLTDDDEDDDDDDVITKGKITINDITIHEPMVRRKPVKVSKSKRAPPKTVIVLDQGGDSDSEEEEEEESEDEDEDVNTNTNTNKNAETEDDSLSVSLSPAVEIHSPLQLDELPSKISLVTTQTADCMQFLKQLNLNLNSNSNSNSTTNTVLHTITQQLPLIMNKNNDVITETNDINSLISTNLHKLNSSIDSLDNKYKKHFELYHNYQQKAKTDNELNFKRVKNLLKKAEAKHQQLVNSKINSDEYKTLETEYNQVLEQNAEYENEIKRLNQRLEQSDTKISGLNQEIEQSQEKHQQELQQLDEKMKIDVTELNLKIEMITNQLHETETNTSYQLKTQVETNALEVGNLQRMNDALTQNLQQLSQEFEDYKRKFNAGTATNNNTTTPETTGNLNETLFFGISPNSAMISPVYPKSKLKSVLHNQKEKGKGKENQNPNKHNLSYMQQVQQSPLTEGQRSQLIQMSDHKQLELDLKTSLENNSFLKLKLETKQQLINSINKLLQESQDQCKNNLQLIEQYQFVIQLFQLLTATRIEFKSRTKHKRLHENESKNELNELSESKSDECNDNDGSIHTVDDGSQDGVVVGMQVDVSVDVDVDPEFELDDTYFVCRTLNSKQQKMLEFALHRSSNKFIIYNLLRAHKLKHLPEFFMFQTAFAQTDSHLFMHKLLDSMFIKHGVTPT